MYALTEAISELLEQPINERSVNAMLRCPLHEDSSPSFSIHLEEGMWHCFGCEERGSLDGLYKILGKTMGQDLIWERAKKRASEPIEIRQTHDFSSLANSYIHGLRQAKAQAFLRAYCKPRGISDDAISRFGVGYDSERDALSFPYTDQEGRVTGIKYRYRNGFKASESGSVYGIFGLGDILGKRDVIICEGETDTLSTYSRYSKRGGDTRGICGTSGASVSDTQWSRFGLHFLFASRVYLLYDADGAGDRCADVGMRVLGTEKCIRLRPPEGKDATEFYAMGGKLEDIGLEDDS